MKLDKSCRGVTSDRSMMSVLLFVLVTSAHAQTGNLSSLSSNFTSSIEKRQQLTAVAINSTAIRCEWQSITDDNCPTVRYIIRFKTAVASRARSVRFTNTTTSTVLGHLRPATNYHLRLVVDTVCSKGRGKASRWVAVETPKLTSNDRITKSVSHQQPRDSRDLSRSNQAAAAPANVPGPPQSVRTRVLRPDTVLVSWQPPLDGGIVSGYMVGYGEGVPDVNWQYLESHRRNVTIKNLKPSTQYVVSVRAFNDVDKGPVIYDLVYTVNTYSSATSSRSSVQTPTRLRTRVLSATSVSLQWFDSTLGSTQRIHDNRYYNVHYQAVPNGKTMSVIVKDLSVVMHDLEPATSYEFKVRTVREGQTSPFSDVIISSTLDTNAAASLGLPHQPPRYGSSSRSSSDKNRDDADEEDYNNENDDGDDVNGFNDYNGGPSKTRSKETPTPARKQHQLPQSLSDTGKTKRDQAIEPEVMQAADQLIPPSPPSSAAGKLGAVTHFSTMVLHRISAYVTWPAVPASTGRCVSETENQARAAVAGYRLRYQPVDVISEFVARSMTENFVLLESLQPNTKYRYQLKYLFVDGSETDWSIDAMLDTNTSSLQ